MLGKNFDFTPSASDEPMGAVFLNAPKEVKLQESKIPIAPDTDSYHDDTSVFYKPGFRQKRFREDTAGQFTRGVPTDGETSAKNYDQDKIKIIDGEHKTLLSLGKITEAFEDDDHSGHMLQHRLLLASGDLSETQRNALMEHIASHQKMYGKRLKAVQASQKEAAKQRKDILNKRNYGPGVGQTARALPAITNDVIPQDSWVDTERKRTAGNIAMEARLRRFNHALRASGRSRRYL